MLVQRTVFQQNNGPKHTTARRTTAFFRISRIKAVGLAGVITRSQSD